MTVTTGKFWSWLTTSASQRATRIAKNRPPSCAPPFDHFDHGVGVVVWRRLVLQDFNTAEP